MTFEEELTALSAKCKHFIRSGQISMYSATLKEMADLFRKNGRTNDQIKTIVISFYIDLSGFSRAPFIDRSLIEQLQIVLRDNSIGTDELEHLFYKWIHPDMISQHALRLKDSWYLLRLCAEGKAEHADYILTKI